LYIFAAKNKKFAYNILKKKKRGYNKHQEDLWTWLKKHENTGLPIDGTVIHRIELKLKG
jgi:hypothetical protein